mgnify:FL=1
MILLFLENLIISISAIFENKVRSILTALGIIIGVYSVTMMGTLIVGLDKTFEGSMSFLGKDVLYVGRWEWFSDLDWWEMKNRPRIQENYIEKIKSKSNLALAIAPERRKGVSISYKENTTGIEIFGTNEDYLETVSLNIVSGRFITNSEDRSGSRVIVIGDGVRKAFFKSKNPIGEKIKINNINFRIVGVLEEQGKFMGIWSLDNRAIIPMGTYERIFTKRDFLTLRIKVPEEKLYQSKDEILAIMRHLRSLKPRQKNDFSINHSVAFEKQYNQLKLAIGGTGTFITLLSLIVGGIGVMNIMFVSVKERTREIGVRKAIGATKRMIMSQFLMEAIMICFFAGLAGLFFAYISSLLLGNFFPSTLNFNLAFFAILMSMAVGIISGLIPSYRASKLDPIESLRYE